MLCFLRICLFGVLLIWGRFVVGSGGYVGGDGWVGDDVLRVGKYEEFGFWVLDFFCGGGVGWDDLNGGGV